jgi:hypothetical protein
MTLVRFSTPDVKRVTNVTIEAQQHAPAVARSPKSVVRPASNRRDVKAPFFVHCLSEIRDLTSRIVGATFQVTLVAAAS